MIPHSPSVGGQSRARGSSAKWSLGISKHSTLRHNECEKRQERETQQTRSTDGENQGRGRQPETMQSTEDQHHPQTYSTQQVRRFRLCSRYLVRPSSMPENWDGSISQKGFWIRRMSESSSTSRARQSGAPHCPSRTG
jgi:hypothetical protein